MRKLTYELASPDESGWMERSGDLVSLLLDCPFFFVGKVIPPMQALNGFLRVASDNASISGASCRWVPFEVEAAEYSGLVDELERQQFRFIAPPDWVTTYDDWNIWCGDIVWGIPALGRRKLHKQASEIEAKMEEALEALDYAAAAKFLEQFLELQTDEVTLISKHRLPEPRIPLCRTLP